MITKFFKKVFSDLKRVDKILLICSMLLLVIGLLMVYSASNYTALYKLNDRNYFAYRQLLYIGIGLVMFILAMIIDSKHYGPISWFLTFIFIGTLILVLVLPNTSANGSRSWLPLFGGFKFQPSEFIKVVSIVWMAHLCSGIPRLKLAVRYVTLFLVVVTIFVLIAVEPDLGTALIYLLTIFFMFLSLQKTPKTKRRLLIGSLIGITVLTLALFFTKTILVDRIESRFDYLNPCSEEHFYTTGTQLCNGYIAFNNGGLLGTGVGKSTQKYLYLPEAHTDFILAITVEELGFIVTFLILGLMFVCLWRIYVIAARATSSYRRLICYGIFCYILIHIIINILGVTGIMPLTGVPLPFLSYGGSFIICLITALGIVQRVNIETMYEKNK